MQEPGHLRHSGPQDDGRGQKESEAGCRGVAQSQEQTPDHGDPGAGETGEQGHGLDEADQERRFPGQFLQGRRAPHRSDQETRGRRGSEQLPEPVLEGEADGRSRQGGQHDQPKQVPLGRGTAPWPSPGAAPPRRAGRMRRAAPPATPTSGAGAPRAPRWRPGSAPSRPAPRRRPRPAGRSTAKPPPATRKGGRGGLPFPNPRYFPIWSIWARLSFTTEAGRDRKWTRSRKAAVLPPRELTAHFRKAVRAWAVRGSGCLRLTMAYS